MGSNDSAESLLTKWERIYKWSDETKMFYLSATMESVNNIESEIKSWLEIILEKENLKDIKVEILGNSEKGDGYIGDIFFVRAIGTAENDSIKEYDLVLKCSKRSQALRENSPVKEAFINEIYVYKTILPIFTQFQRDKGIEDPFNSVPKCYGSHTTEDMEIIVFENLKKNGYVLWNKRKPLTRKHINMVVKEYGKFHAISVAMRDQQPEKFEKLAKRLHDTFKKFVEKGNMETLFGTAIQDVYDALQNDLDDIILSKWKNFRQQINFVFKELMQNVNGLTVVTHGDCWNNNFMFYSDVDNIDLPSEVAILDWQISKLSSPIFDLSYFLFACISKDDIEDLDIVLNEYYQSFSNYLRRLGSDPEVLYPRNKFLSEWKQFSKFGIFMSSLVMKVCSVDVDEVPDIVETAEKGQDFSKAFLFTVRDKTNLRNRMRHIVKYTVESDLI